MVTAVMEKPRALPLRQTYPDDQSRRVAVVGPHIDDPAFMGGQVQIHLKQGDEVFFIYATYGDASCPEYPQSLFTQMRIDEELLAAGVLGMRKENLLFLPELYKRDNQLCGEYPPPVREGGLYPGRINERVLFHYLLMAFRMIRPTVVYIPYGGPLDDPKRHPDHTIVSEQSLVALRFAPGKYFRDYGDEWVQFSVEEKYYYEIDVPFDFWGEYENLKEVDVTEVWERKIAALREYSSQDVDFFEERMLRWMEERGFPEEKKFELFFHIQ